MTHMHTTMLDLWKSLDRPCLHGKKEKALSSAHDVLQATFDNAHIIGGHPLMLQNEPWPTYQGEPMAYILQLSLDTLPTQQFPFLPSSGWIQVFTTTTPTAAHATLIHRTTLDDTYPTSPPTSKQTPPFQQDPTPYCLTFSPYHDPCPVDDLLYVLDTTGSFPGMRAPEALALLEHIDTMGGQAIRILKRAYQSFLHNIPNHSVQLGGWHRCLEKFGPDLITPPYQPFLTFHNVFAKPSIVTLFLHQSGYTHPGDLRMTWDHSFP